MALPEIQLGTGEILVTETTSTLGLYAYDAQKMKFGYVEAVNSSADRAAVGNYIVFNPATAKDFVYGSTRYFIVKEDSISGIEPTPV